MVNGQPNLEEVLKVRIFKFILYMEMLIHNRQVRQPLTKTILITYQVKLILFSFLKKLDVWMEQEGLFNEDTKSIFVTCGDWDLKVM